MQKTKFFAVVKLRFANIIKIIDFDEAHTSFVNTPNTRLAKIEDFCSLQNKACKQKCLCIQNSKNFEIFAVQENLRFSFNVKIGNIRNALHFLSHKNLVIFDDFDSALRPANFLFAAFKILISMPQIRIANFDGRRNSKLFSRVYFFYKMRTKTLIFLKKP